MAALVSASPMLDLDVDKLTYEIFSLLENKFLFGYENHHPNSNSNPKLAHSLSLSRDSFKSSTKHNPPASKVRILSIDGRGSTDGILAATSLARLESFLRSKSGNPDARIADFFDVVAGSGAGGILAALLFTRGRDGAPMFTADQALRFLIRNRHKIFRSTPSGIFRRIIRPEKLFRKTFGESTLKDTLKSVLIPCYDLATNAPFLFSRADALEMDGYDFKMRDVCASTLTARPVNIASVDRRTRIAAMNGEIAMNNPTAAAITHVLHNKLEFPLCNGVEDLLVVSLGNAQSELGIGNITSSPIGLVKIAGEGASDVVDQAVSMAFGQWRTSNYVRIQANIGTPARKHGGFDCNLSAVAENMLTQKNVESVLFQGRKMVESTNIEKLELFAGEVIKEQERRKTSILATVVLKQASPSPRTSSATTLSILSSS
ncbi:hypothetical protein F2P56_007300 [Juglans regia]|uniref:Patatin n=2 Tax=Juglans regia TaxID=51240 RepID=A0A833Y5A8_JUGRE|nr:patatin-like protein 3 [Juglans regia]KAF5475500.1 hypothetical protein F2P56_007300 [Juglans regia]